MNNYDWLIERLDAFIRKYYANKVIRGALVFLISLLFFVLTVTVGEYYLYLPVWGRVTILSLFIVLGLSSLVAWVIVPLAQMGKLGKVISHERAAQIIGRHFPEISDRLLNILQLKKHPDNYASRELAEASINQKISQISVVPIARAIDLSKNRKYLPYLLPLVLAAVFILVAAPNVFKESTTRLLQPTKVFERPAPFQFIIDNPSLIAVRNSDFIITVTTRGNALPAEAYIQMGRERVPMQPLDNHSFQYTFKNVTEAVPFRFFAAGFYSAENTLKIVQRPVLKSFRVQINYPAYIGKKNEVRNSLGDMTLPAGTTVNWTFVADHTGAATIHFGNGSPVALHASAEARFGYEYRFMNDTAYTITLQNKEATVADSFRYQVQIIPDQYPVIQLQQARDTVSGKQVVLTGTAGDDYGITRVSFNYEVGDKNKTIEKKSIPIKITPGAMTTFQQYFDIQTLNLLPGQKVSYYIEAWDNDGVHGSKASRSEVMAYFMYNDKQIDSAINENSRQINSGISNSASRTQQLQNDYKDMQSKMLQSENMDWDQQQSLQDMMKQQMDLKTQVENIKQRFEEQMQQSEQKKYSDDIKEKQKELDKQLDNLLNDELKEEMKKLQDLMDKLNKEQAVNAMQQLQQDNKLFKMDMQRMQELMKKLEMQMRMEDMAGKLDDLAKKERELENKTDKAEKGDNKSNKSDKSDKTDDKQDRDAASQKESGKDADKTSKDLAKEQKEIKDALDKAMKEDLKEAQKLSKETKQNDRLEDEEKQGNDASKEMQESENSLSQKQNSKAKRSQNEAAKNLEGMAKAMRKKASGMDIDQIEIDIKATRQILSNLIRLSFDQEDLMDKVNHTSPATQAYITNQEEQNRLHRNSQMIRDSLFQLSKRVEKLPVIVNRETTALEQNMQRALDALENRNINVAVTDQQYVMTHTNNLALMLNEILNNLMQMEGQAKQPGGEGSCNKPGGFNPKPGAGKQLADIITQQQQLGESMQKMQGGKKPGDKEGKKSSNAQNNGGSQGGQGEGENEYGDAEQLARLAEQQANIRRQIQELTSLLNSKGLGNAKELREIEQKMDKNESDLVNRKVNSDLIYRQKEIQVRLLEAEKSLREQEQDDKRSSRSAQEMTRPVPPALQKYLTDQKQLLELYKTVPPQLKPYYKDMVENYFSIIGK